MTEQARFTLQGVLPSLRAADKPAVLMALAQFAVKLCGGSAVDIAARLAEREALGSTGIGHGIAVPHARIEGLAAPVGFFARLERPIDFSSIDEKKVDLVFLLLSPAGAAASHLAALASVSRRLRDPLVRGAIRGATSPEAIRVALIG